MRDTSLESVDAALGFLGPFDTGDLVSVNGLPMLRVQRLFADGALMTDERTGTTVWIPASGVTSVASAVLAHGITVPAARPHGIFDNRVVHSDTGDESLPMNQPPVMPGWAG